MKKLMATVAASFALLTAVPTIAAKADRGNAEIPFVAFGGVRNWTATNNSAVYLQAPNGQWYRADLMGPCTGLPFAFGIGVQTDFGDTFDRFSSIIVDGHRCPVMSVSKVAAPPAPAAKVKAG